MQPMIVVCLIQNNPTGALQLSLDLVLNFASATYNFSKEKLKTKSKSGLSKKCSIYVKKAQKNVIQGEKEQNLGLEKVGTYFLRGF